MHCIQRNQRAIIESKGFLNFIELPTANKPGPQAPPQVQEEFHSANDTICAFGELLSSIMKMEEVLPFDQSSLNEHLKPYMTKDSKAYIFFNISPLVTDFPSTVNTLKFASLLKGSQRQQQTEEQNRNQNAYGGNKDYVSHQQNQGYENEGYEGNNSNRGGGGYQYNMQDPNNRMQFQRRPQQQGGYNQNQYGNSGYGQQQGQGYQDNSRQRQYQDNQDQFNMNQQNRNQKSTFRGEMVSGHSSAQKKMQTGSQFGSAGRSVSNNEAFDGMILEPLPGQVQDNQKFSLEKSDHKKSQGPEESFSMIQGGARIGSEKKGMNMENLDSRSLSPGNYQQNARSGISRSSNNPPQQTQKSYQQPGFSQESSGQQSRQQYSQNQAGANIGGYRGNQNNQRQSQGYEGYGNSQPQQGYNQGQNNNYQNRNQGGQRFAGNTGGHQSQYKQGSQMGNNYQNARQNPSNQYENQRGAGFNQNQQSSFGSKPQYGSQSGGFQSGNSQGRGGSQGSQNRNIPSNQTHGTSQDSFGNRGSNMQSQPNQQRATGDFYQNNMYTGNNLSPTNQPRQPQGYSLEKSQTGMNNPDNISHPNIQHSPKNQPGPLMNQASHPQKQGDYRQNAQPNQRNDQHYFGKPNQGQEYGGNNSYQGNQRGGSYDNYGSNQRYQGGGGNNYQNNRQPGGGGSRGYQGNQQNYGNKQQSYNNQRNYNNHNK